MRLPNLRLVRAHIASWGNEVGKWGEEAIQEEHAQKPQRHRCALIVTFDVRLGVIVWRTNHTRYIFGGKDLVRCG